MRAIVAFGVALLVLAVFGMAAAVVGRAADWSPYALVMLGAIAGFLVGFAATVYLYVTDPDDEDPYLAGWRDGHADAIESRRATR